MPSVLSSTFICDAVMYNKHNLAYFSNLRNVPHFILLIKYHKRQNWLTTPKCTWWLCYRSKLGFMRSVLNITLFWVGSKMPGKPLVPSVGTVFTSVSVVGWTADGLTDFFESDGCLNELLPFPFDEIPFPLNLAKPCPLLRKVFCGLGEPEGMAGAGTDLVWNRKTTFSLSPLQHRGQNYWVLIV